MATRNPPGETDPRQVAQADKGKNQLPDSCSNHAESPAGLPDTAHSPNIDTVLQVYKESARQKRKKKPQMEAGPSNKASSSVEGLVDVTVSYDQALHLALGFGVPITEVQATAQEVLKEYEVSCSRVSESPLQMVGLADDSGEEWSDAE